MAGWTLGMLCIGIVILQPAMGQGNWTECGKLELKTSPRLQSSEFTKGVDVVLEMKTTGNVGFSSSLSREHLAFLSDVTQELSPHGFIWGIQQDGFVSIKVESPSVLRLRFFSKAFHARWDEAVQITVKEKGLDCVTHDQQSVNQRIMAGHLIKHVKYQMRAAVGAGVLTVASAAVGAGTLRAASVGRIALLLGLRCSEDNEVEKNEEMLWEFHLLEGSVGDFQAKYIFGAVVYNTGIQVAFFIILLIAAGVVAAVKGVPFKDGLALLRSPGLMVGSLLFVLSGLVLAASRILFYPSEANAAAVGTSCVLLLVTLALPPFFYFLILRRVPTLAVCIPIEAVEKRGGPPPSSRATKIFLGTSAWVSVDGRFVEMAGVVFERLRQGRQWFLLVEMIPVIFMAVIGAWHSTTRSACNARNWLIVSCIAAYTGLCLFFRPFSSFIDNLLLCVHSILLFFSAFMLAIGFQFMQDDEGGTIKAGASQTSYNTATYMIFMATLTLIVHGTKDLLCLVVDMCKGYTRSFWDHWEQKKEAPPSSPVALSPHETFSSHGGGVAVDIPAEDPGLPLLRAGVSQETLHTPCSPHNQGQEKSQVVRGRGDDEVSEPAAKDTVTSTSTPRSEELESITPTHSSRWGDQVIKVSSTPQFSTVDDLSTGRLPSVPSTSPRKSRSSRHLNLVKLPVQGAAGRGEPTWYPSPTTGAGSTSTPSSIRRFSSEFPPSPRSARSSRSPTSPRSASFRRPTRKKTAAPSTEQSSAPDLPATKIYML